MSGVSEHRRPALFCSSSLNLWDMRVDLNCTSKKLDCHLSWPCRSLKHASPFKNNRKKKRSCMQHVYEVYGNWINMAFVKGLLMHKGYREWKSAKKCFKTITFVSHVPCCPFCLCDPFFPCDPLSPRDPFSPFVEKSKVIIDDEHISIF